MVLKWAEFGDGTLGLDATYVAVRRHVPSRRGSLAIVSLEEEMEEMKGTTIVKGSVHVMSLHSLQRTQ